MAICPKCRKLYNGYPALTREDNKTHICPDCGMKEAIKSIPRMNGRKPTLQGSPAEENRKDKEYQKGKIMGENTEVKTTEEIKKEWDEVKLCADLIREGKARVFVATRRDGSVYRYTKLR